MPVGRMTLAYLIDAGLGPAFLAMLFALIGIGFAWMSAFYKVKSFLQDPLENPPPQVKVHWILSGLSFGYLLYAVEYGYDIVGLTDLFLVCAFFGLIIAYGATKLLYWPVFKTWEWWSWKRTGWLGSFRKLKDPHLFEMYGRGRELKLHGYGGIEVTRTNVVIQDRDEHGTRYTLSYPEVQKAAEAIKRTISGRWPRDRTVTFMVFAILFANGDITSKDLDRMRRFHYSGKVQIPGIQGDWTNAGYFGGLTLNVIISDHQTHAVSDLVFLDVDLLIECEHDRMNA